MSFVEGPTLPSNGEADAAYMADAFPDLRPETPGGLLILGMIGDFHEPAQRAPESLHGRAIQLAALQKDYGILHGELGPPPYDIRSKRVRAIINRGREAIAEDANFADSSVSIHVMAAVGTFNAALASRG